jgi:dienelactone hydrolase
VKYRAAADVELPADIYFNPEAKGTRPTLLLISGTEDARDWGGYRDFGRLAAERGFVGIVPAKRFPRGGAGIAQGRSDTVALLEQLAKLAPDLIDRARVGLWAFSGGGTTLSIAYAKERPPLSCVIGFYPAVSLNVPAPDDWLGTYSPAHVVALHGSASAPPTLIVRAGKDTEMLNNGIADFAAKALARNVPLTLVNLPAAQHGFDLFDDEDWSRRAIEDAFAFARAAMSEPAR